VFVASTISFALVLALSGSAFAEPLSEKEWRQAANSACDEFQEDRSAILPESGLAATTREQALPYVEAAVPLYEGLIDSIKSLEEPKARRKKVKKLLAALRSAVATVQNNPLAAFSAFDDPFAKANRAAKKLRLASCTGLGDQRL
jgi:hypothetical protein